MHRRTVRNLLAGAAMAGAAALIATPAASAQASWTVTPGGDVSAAAGTTTLTDTTTGTKLTCASSDATATLKGGSGLSGTGIGDITDIGFTDCSGPVGITFTVTPNELPWKLNAVSYDSATGTTTGTITGIDATLTGSLCSAHVTGAVDASFTNSTDVLTISGGGLTVDSVSGCLGLINNGDNAAFDGVYQVTPGQDITSP